jgi:hypothetical protein
MNSQPGQKLINVSWAHIPGMLHLVETDEIANPIPVGFLCTDAVVIHTNDGMNLITQSKWLPVHGLTPVIAVYLYSIIVGTNHRSQMITWKDEKCSTKLLFHTSMGGRLWKPECVIMKWPDFRIRGGAYQVTVIRNREAMSRLGFLILVVVVCAISIVLSFYHATFTGDTVASIFGYFFSLVIVPLLIFTSLAFSALAVLPYKFNQAQKWSLFIIPFGCLFVLMGYFFWALQYGEH